MVSLEHLPHVVPCPQVENPLKFVMEGSQRRLKRMLYNNRSVSLPCCCLGVQVVLDNHAIDDGLRLKGWDFIERSMCV